MKKDVHPQYNMVVFEDASSGFRILTGSTLSAKETTTWEDGKSYPLIHLEVSSASHPFYTGKQVLVDTAKRIDKFKERLEKKSALVGKSKGKAAKNARNKKVQTDTTTQAEK